MGTKEIPIAGIWTTSIEGHAAALSPYIGLYIFIAVHFPDV